MDLKLLLGIPSALIAAGSIAFGIDSRYMHHGEGDAIRMQQVQGDLQLQLEIYREKLKRLRAKPNPTQDELDEIQFTLAIIAKLEGELLRK